MRSHPPPPKAITYNRLYRDWFQGRRHVGPDRIQAGKATTAGLLRPTASPAHAGHLLRRKNKNPQGPS